MALPKQAGGALAALLLALAAFAAAGVFAVPQASAQGAGTTPDAERILDYHSHIVVRPDAALDVTETIRVNVQGNAIQRGIYRDFPTTYTNPNGTVTRVGFTVLHVRRNGQPEPYTVESISNGKRVRIGDADVFIAAGEHTYEIGYRTTRQLFFGDAFDALYWNVTGNFWRFEIGRAFAEIRLPAGASVLKVDGYTGDVGGQGRNFRASIMDYGAVIETTGPLRPGQGLTVSVTWPKGYVSEPTQARKAQYYLQDNLGAILALISVFGVSAYYLSVWIRHGRDPQGGAIFPRYSPPDGLSPAACRYIRRMGYDRKAFTSALINMAVKGYLLIDDQSKPISLEVRPDASDAALTAGEKKIARRLFSGSRSKLVLKNKYHTTISGAISALKLAISNEFEKDYFVRNTRLWLTGLGLSLAGAAAAAALSVNAAVPVFLALWLTVWTAGCTFLLKRVFDQWRDLVQVPGDTVEDFIGAVFTTAFALPFLIAEIVVFGTFATAAGGVLALTFACLGALNVAFYHLLKAPTLQGRRIMEEIEGFRQYLSVAEQHRLNMTGPARTPELFEKYLPFALALDVENEWSEKFADVLAAAGNDPESGYHPGWYRGTRWNSFGPGSFSSALGSSLGSSVASAATAPGSRSGSGGGGFSGGGGGGGGGGGW